MIYQVFLSAYFKGLYCALKYTNDLPKALQVAVFHDGDSDSTGAVTGQILGALLGTTSLPSAEVKRLDVLDPLTKMIEKLGQKIC